MRKVAERLAGERLVHGPDDRVLAMLERRKRVTFRCVIRLNRRAGCDRVGINEISAAGIRKLVHCPVRSRSREYTGQ